MKLSRLQIGAGLLEAMIALFVIAAGIVVLMKFQAEILHHRGYLSQQSEAVQLAENKLDDLRNYSVIATTSGSKAYDDIVSGSSTATGASTSYTLVWTVVEFLSPPYKTINITVSWVDSSGATKSVSLSSLVAKVNPVNSGVIMQGL